MDKIENIISEINIGLRDELRISKLDDIDDGIWYRIQLYRNGILTRGFQDNNLSNALQLMLDYTSENN